MILFYTLDCIYAMCTQDACLVVRFSCKTTLPLSLNSTEEKLRSVCIGPRIGHAQNPRSGVLQNEVLIGKLIAVDGLASGSISTGEIATLDTQSAQWAPIAEQ